MLSALKDRERRDSEESNSFGERYPSRSLFSIICRLMCCIETFGHVRPKISYIFGGFTLVRVNYLYVWSVGKEEAYPKTRSLIDVKRSELI